MQQPNAISSLKAINDEELKKIQLDILDKVHDFCKSNDLNYSLAYGTLLGAVRHKGFIPWDDDIDIMMPRNDYDIFVESFENIRYKVITNEMNKDYWLPYAKVYDDYTIMFEETSMPLNIGVSIDIFPIDNYPNSLKESVKIFKKKQVYNYLHLLKILKVRNQRSFLKNLFILISHAVISPFKMSFIIKNMDNLSRKFQNVKTDYMGILIANDNKLSERLPSVFFHKTQPMTFEGKKYNCITEYDKYLKASYGDYMKLPPEDERVSHHSFDAYWK